MINQMKRKLFGKNKKIITCNKEKQWLKNTKMDW